MVSYHVGRALAKSLWQSCVSEIEGNGCCYRDNCIGRWFQALEVLKFYTNLKILVLTALRYVISVVGTVQIQVIIQRSPSSTWFCFIQY